MKNSIWILTAFGIVALVQLLVPAKMIWDREDILRTGKEFNFKTAPIDPYDPFRGKYVALGFEETSVPVPNQHDWDPGETVYISLEADSEGFVHAVGASRTRPDGTEAYLKTTVDYFTAEDSGILYYNLPFDRYYMEESKAYEAEQTYLESAIDSTATTYAVVSIKHGDAVLKDVMINGESIRDIVRRRLDEME